MSLGGIGFGGCSPRRYRGALSSGRFGEGTESRGPERFDRRYDCFPFRQNFCNFIYTYIYIYLFIIYIYSFSRRTFERRVLLKESRRTTLHIITTDIRTSSHLYMFTS